MSKKRLLAGFLAATMTLSCFTGCTSVKKSDLDKDMKELVAATYGSDNIYLDEVNYYVRNTQYSYEYYYYMYGVSDVWSDESALNSLFESSLATINQTKVLNEYAEANGITLTEEEQGNVDKQVEEAASSTEAAAAIAGQDKDLLTNIFTENAIANKVYYTIREAAEIKTQKDDCIKNAVEYILFTEAQESTEETAAEGETEAETITYTEADANAALELLKTEKDMSKVADKYSLTVSTGNYNATEEQSTELGKAAAAMKAGESQVVYVEGTGWYLLNCTTDNDEEATQSAYESAVDTEKTEYFNSVYAEMSKQKFDVVDEVVQSLDIANTPMLVLETESETVAETE